MNRMYIKFHKICAIVKEISVHNRNTHVHQALFSDGTASYKNKLTWVMEYMYEVELFHLFSSRILQNVCPDSVEQCQTAQTVQSDVGFTLSVNLWDISLSNI